VVQLKSCVRVLIVALLAVLLSLAIPVAVADPAPGARITGTEPVKEFAAGLPDTGRWPAR